MFQQNHLANATVGAFDEAPPGSTPCTSSMRIFPTSSREWIDVALAPFKTYPILMLLIAAVWSAEMRGEPMIGLILIGYLVCLIVVAWVAMTDTFFVKCATTHWRWSAAIILLGFLFALRWLPTLAE